ncbi:MAG TPA: FHA domain-containing protein [Pseudonocardiaceae bacterium]|nr:FHA domain-containing protein [Pseudonocardiaceae bacterium]
MAGAPSSPTAPTVVTPVAAPTENCPECGEPRTGRFCEGCSYDFVAGASRTPVVAAPAPDAAPAVVAPDPAPVAGGWSVVVTADRAYFDAVQQQDGPDVPNITFPTYCPDRHFPLTGKEMRIGRVSRSRGLAPEIDLTGPPQDPGISHLHAVLVAQDDGGWAVLDPGSTNGTTVNDDPEPIATDVAIPVKDGDRIHLGAWTTITIQAP